MTLLDASFKGVKFDVMDVSDDISRDVQSHSYPYIDGADQEDLGRQARQISMTAVFWGDFYEVELNRFLTVLDERGAGELVHPVFGVFPQMQLTNHKVQHKADDVDYCTVSLQFVEHQDSNPFFALSGVLQALETLGIDVRDFMDQVITVFHGAMSFYRQGNTLIERVEGVKNLFTSYLMRVKRFFATNKSSGSSAHSLVAWQSNQTATVRDGDAMLETDFLSHADVILQPRAFFADLQSVIEEAIPIEKALLMYVQRNIEVKDDGLLFSNWLAVMRSAEKAEKLLQDVAKSPAVTIDDTLLLDAIVAAVISKTIIDNAIAVLELAQEQKLFSPQQIEKIVNDVRNSINACISKQRRAFEADKSRPITEGLKTIAYKLQDTALKILEVRPPLVAYEVVSDGNLHLLAHHLYSDSTRADEILRLNPSIKNPNFIHAGEVLYVYAE